MSLPNDPAGCAVFAVVVLVLTALLLGIASMLGGAVLWAAWTWVAVPAWGWTPLAYWQCCLVWLALSFVLGLVRGVSGRGGAK